MMYVRYPLSLRNVEDLLAERGIDISHETIQFWWNLFGPMFAAWPDSDAGRSRKHDAGVSNSVGRLGTSRYELITRCATDIGDRRHAIPPEIISAFSPLDDPFIGQAAQPQRGSFSIRGK
jgi:hypothetical protein